MKTNKSYAKRIKVTKNGKVVARRPGQSHFNAKESGSEGGETKRGQKVKSTTLLDIDTIEVLPKNRKTKKTNWNLSKELLVI